MKKILYFLFLLFSSHTLIAQSHLRVDSISGIPAQGDSTFEYNPYTINLIIQNLDTAQITDTIDVFIQRQDTAHPADILYSDTVPMTIAGGGSIQVQSNNYVFSPVNFDDGDNIVVVWPQARTTPVTIIDSSVFHIFYVSLVASTPSGAEKDFMLYPNPATRYLLLGKSDSRLKQVRIYDISGREVYRSDTPGNFIDIESWNPGTYLIEIEKVDGGKRVVKVQKN
jgi:hypothetical protein